jgi:hypothetical protein
MFDLYHAPDTASYRQSELYDEIANDRLAREAQGKGHSSTEDRMSPVRRVIAAVSTALTTATEAMAATGRRPHRI